MRPWNLRTKAIECASKPSQKEQIEAIIQAFLELERACLYSKEKLQLPIAYGDDK